MRPVRPVILWGWIGVVGVGGLFVLFIALEQSGSTVRAGGIALGSWFPVVSTFLGTLIALRQPGNRIAWLLIGIGFAVLAEFFLQLSLGAQPASPSKFDLVAIVLMHVALPAAIYLAFLVPLTFPSGRFLSQRQNLLAWPGAIMLSTQLLVTSFTEEIGPPFPPEEQAWTVANPVGFLPTTALDITTATTIILLLLTAIGGVFSLVLRYRRSPVVARAQIRWLLFSTSIVGVVLLLVAVTNVSESAVGAFLLVVAFVSVPVTITVAITRYRLFEIDRIISRTISYAVVVAVLAAAFFVLVALITVLLPAQDSLAVAGSTLAVAALFNPLRKRVQNVVDRRFNRTAYQAEIIIEAFSSRLGESLTTTQISADWQQTVNESLQPRTSSIWIKEGGSDGPK
jgi:hypothetical protein